MRRWLFAALVALVLAVPAASAAQRPCWSRVINDWYDNGKLDRTYSCACLQEAIAHLPEDGMHYADWGSIFRAEKRACSPLASSHVAAAAAKKSHHTNWPARISASVLLFVAFGLLIWRRRQRATSRDGRRAPDRE